MKSSASPNMRTVYLDTSQKGPLGFSIRGGLEFGFGVYVSAVEPGLQAHRKGLLVGDRIYRVNGYSLRSALQREVISLMFSRRLLVLAVKHVGRMPFYIDSFTGKVVWLEVNNSLVLPDISSSLLHLDTSFSHLQTQSQSQQFIDLINCLEDGPVQSLPQCDHESTNVVTILTKLPINTPLGCQLTEGIVEHSGVFIRSVNPHSLLSDCGVKVGDEILEVNKIPVQRYGFSEAKHIMETQPVTQLKIRKPRNNIIVFPSCKCTHVETNFLCDKRNTGNVKERVVVTDYKDLTSPVNSRASAISPSLRVEDNSLKLPSPALSPAASAKSQTDIFKKQETAVIRIPSFFGKKVLPEYPSSFCKATPSPILQLHQFSEDQIKGKRLSVVQIQKEGTDLGMEIEGGIGSVTKGRIVVSKLEPDGLVFRNGEICVGDEILMVNGCKIVDTTLGEAKKILHKASTDQKKYFEFVVHKSPASSPYRSNLQSHMMWSENEDEIYSV
ncbi:USH1C [Bugula neritina]|uniref:USH1C n=1 Tax=Bugula neritina TaxID=10212 RepID=A0A7J7JFX9_BUGNE|nr:USH1C [Bugula neritina]